MIPHVLKSIMLIFRKYIMQNNLRNMTTPPQWKLSLWKITALTEAPDKERLPYLCHDDLISYDKILIILVLICSGLK